MAQLEPGPTIADGGGGGREVGKGSGIGRGHVEIGFHVDFTPSVTLLNVSDKVINLNGWQLQDDENRVESLVGYDVGAGDAVRVRLATMRLKNKDGGRIKLVSPDQVVVQEIAYRKADVSREGWSVLF